MIMVTMATWGPECLHCTQLCDLDGLVSVDAHILDLQV